MPGFLSDLMGGGKDFLLGRRGIQPGGVVGQVDGQDLTAPPTMDGPRQGGFLRELLPAMMDQSGLAPLIGAGRRIGEGLRRRSY